MRIRQREIYKMIIKAPQPFTFEAADSNRAVLLLHGFTGNTNDVKRLGRYLNQQGYTVHAPLYKGHGVDPETLIHTAPEEWWQSAIEGYEYLRSLGYEKIAVGGVSLGGAFSLRLAEKFETTGVLTMSAPAIAKTRDSLNKRIVDYAINFKKLQGTYNPISDDIALLQEEYDMPELARLQSIINDTSDKLSTIKSPVHILRGMKDDEYYCESADIIYSGVTSRIKSVKSFINTGHIMTLGEERDLVYQEVQYFLDGLQWN